MTLVAVRGVAKSFGQTRVLGDVDLDVGQGEVVALLGPSGCGKTTLLRLVAGLDAPDTGSISIAGERVAGEGAWVPPEARAVGLVFQDYALFPHLTVEENVGFGLRRLAASRRSDRVREVLSKVHVEGLGARYPHELSGGQQQRVALARAIAPSPRVLLLDEPFSNLDASLRRRLRLELRGLLGEVGVGAIFVTHDQDEALSLAERVAVMDGGIIVQVGPPRALYERPRSVAVARAVGEVNILPGEARGGVVRCALGELHGEGPDGSVQVIVRPECLVLGASGVEAEIVASDYTGREEIVLVRVSGADEPLACRRDARATDERSHVRAIGPVGWVES